jgi:hypothetical protein
LYGLGINRAVRREPLKEWADLIGTVLQDISSQISTAKGGNCGGGGGKESSAQQRCG